MNNIEQVAFQIEQIKNQIRTIESQIEDKQSEINGFEYECDESEYNDFLDEIYGEVTICGYAYSASQALKDVDPIAYRCGMSDYCSNYDLDNCDEYKQLESELDDLQSKLEDLQNDLDSLEDELFDLESEE